MLLSGMFYDDFGVRCPDKDVKQQNEEYIVNNFSSICIYVITHKNNVKIYSEQNKSFYFLDFIPDENIQDNEEINKYT